jgi:hypothetical protein
MSAGVKFKLRFTIVCNAGLPGILKYALATVVMFLKNPDEFSVVNPLTFNPAAFLDPIDSSRFLYAAAICWDRRLSHASKEPPERRLQAGLPAPQNRQNFGRTAPGLATS